MVSGASYFLILFLSHFMMVPDAATCLNISGNNAWGRGVSVCIHIYENWNRATESKDSFLVGLTLYLWVSGLQCFEGT
jgi:hypothetical protein